MRLTIFRGSRCQIIISCHTHSSTYIKNKCSKLWQALSHLICPISIRIYSFETYFGHIFSDDDRTILHKADKNYNISHRGSSLRLVVSHQHYKLPITSYNPHLSIRDPRNFNEMASRLPLVIDGSVLEGVSLKRVIKKSLPNYKLKYE